MPTRNWGIGEEGKRRRGEEEEGKEFLVQNIPLVAWWSPSLDIVRDTGNRTLTEETRSVEYRDLPALALFGLKEKYSFFLFRRLIWCGPVIRKHLAVKGLYAFTLAW